ncbi:hypothetical protein SEA_SLIMJIMMY_154 [Mycobacterium phage SlimJimmy]|nr:hypothetical protein SEA_SLIMJIMMY_154 [Mycobacterium phage SlimJimmy]
MSDAFAAETIVVFAQLGTRRIQGTYGSRWDAAGAVMDFAERNGYRIEMGQDQIQGTESGHFEPKDLGAPAGFWIWGPKA